MTQPQAGILDHYRKLLFFALHRFEGDNYRLMGEYFTGVLIAEIEQFASLAGKRVLDVGGASGVFCKELSRRRQCRAVNLDPKPGDAVWPDTVVASAERIPFEDDAFDVVLCRGVLEHVPLADQQASVNEMHRVVRPGGICYITIPPWYNPHAGHRLKPFHVLPFGAAKFLRRAIFGTTVQAASYAEMGYYPVTFRRMARLIRASGLQVLATRDTHLRVHFLTHIPLVREVAVPAVSFILRKRAPRPIGRPTSPAPSGRA